jgi:hypothetical protein
VGAEGESSVKPVGGSGEKCERPLTVDLRDGRFASIAEAVQSNWPRMLLAPAGGGAVRVQLDGAAEANESPWRVIVAGRRPGDLLEHNLLASNLSQPNRLKDTPRFRPGRVMREVTFPPPAASAWLMRPRRQASTSWNTTPAGTATNTTTRATRGRRRPIMAGSISKK